MKKIKFIAMAFAALCLASCMGDGYADPDMTEQVPASPWGNNKLKEKNVVTIAQLKSDYQTQITNSSFKLIDKDAMIKAVVTGNDISGNLYNEVAVQDATGAILVEISGNGLYGYLPVGQEILIDLKGLYIGGNGKQAEIGGVFTNNKTGNTGIGNIDRATWEKHFKILDEADPSKVVPEEFDLSKLDDEDYMTANAGKLMVIRKVKFANANGKTVWAANDTNTDQPLIDYTTGQRINSQRLVVRTSGYARFANAVLPDGVYDITGIFTRYTTSSKNTWQIAVRNTDDVTASVLAIFQETFGESQGDFKIKDIATVEGIPSIWIWDSRYGMKASAYKDKSNEASSRLISPEIDLSKAKEATLTLDQAINKSSDDPKKECKIQVSTDGTTWEDVEADAYPAGNSWDFITSNVNLNKYCGKKIYIGFLYTSTDSSAPTWEIKNVSVN